MNARMNRTWAAVLLASLAFTGSLAAQQAKGKAELSFPPKLPDGKEVITDTSEDFLKAPVRLQEGVTVATQPPTVDFMFFPGQSYAGNPWSNWGDSLAVNGKYYASIGDHKAPGGNAFLYEYDPEKKTLRQVMDLRKLLNLPDGDYTPGKIHSRIDLGDDGWLYCSTHRGSTKVTTDKFNYKGDWIVRYHPGTGKSEIVVCGPVPKHCIPCSVLDPKRLIFYGGTAAGTGIEGEGIQFFAYDIKAKKVLYSGPNGPSRYMLFSSSTGKVYYTGKEDPGPLMRFDPDKPGAPEQIDVRIGLRAATQETPQGFVYTVSSGQGKGDAELWSFNTRTEQVQNLGPSSVASQKYITSLDVDPTGRYLYYIPGAHGGGEVDGSPVVQFDTKTKQRKVIAFLAPFYKDKSGGTLRGTYSSAVDPRGDKLYITWNVARIPGKAWDCCALTVIHIPQSEREP
jgi:hypothetical protein